MVSKVDEIKALIVGPIMDAIEFNEEDLECFTDNPVEYYRRNDPEVLKFDLKRQCIAFVSDALSRVDKQKKHGILNMILEYTKKTIEDPNSTIVRKEACLLVAERMEKVIFMEHAEAGYDYYLKAAEKFLDNEHGFVRMRACKIISYMMYPEFGDQVVLKSFADKITLLLKDEHLPVRSSAAQAL